MTCAWPFSLDPFIKSPVIGLLVKLITNSRHYQWSLSMVIINGHYGFSIYFMVKTPYQAVLAERHGSTRPTGGVFMCVDAQSYALNSTPHRS